jgi:co-chaperonin GroES (HSP10)
MLRPLYFKKDTGTALLKLSEGGVIETPDEKYKQFSRGELIAITTAEGKTLVGKEVYFESFKEIQVEQDDEKYAFLDVNDIRGYNDVEA